jgi:hypothetical protein
MSYDVYITRKHHWADPEGPEISLAEWLAFVDADPEMELDGFDETPPDDGRAFRNEGECLSIWTAYSEHDKRGNAAWLVHANGNVTVRNPDAEIICKMWSIAQTLSAKVQGDDGEVYDSFARSSHPDAPKRPWWKFW